MNAILPSWILGKTDPKIETLEKHLVAVANNVKFILTESIYSVLLDLLAELLHISNTEALSFALYMAMMHDIGKLHPIFQKAILQSINFIMPKEYADDRIFPSPYRHEEGSAYIANRIWKRDDLFDRRLRECFSQVLRLHHQGKIGENYICSNELWTKIQDDLERKIRKEYPLPEIKDLNDYELDAACRVLTGIIIIADWTASGQMDLVARKELKDKRKTEKRESFKKMFGLEPRRFQKKVIEHFEKKEHLPIFILIETAMGEGKTELALYLAEMLAEYWDKNGLYVGLHAISLANQMIGRVRKVYDDVDLVHSLSWMYQETDPNEDPIEKAWSTSEKRALLAQFAVGTVDQILQIGLLVKYGVVRLVGISNKVLIIDELSAYDVYMTRILERVLDWCRLLKVPVIMISATLPAKRKEEMFGLKPEKAYPIVTSIYRDGRTEQLALDFEDVTVHKEIALDFADQFPTEFEDGCTHIFVNTVKRAQQVYANIQGVEKILLHARFTEARRAELEAELLKNLGPNDRPKKFVAVTTQVGARGLDIDSDRMYSENCPIDEINERSGREWRWPDREKVLEKCRLTIVKHSKESEYIYYPLILERTEKQLKTHKVLRVPEDLSEDINAVYDIDCNETDIENFVKMQTDLEFKKASAEAVLFPAPKKKGFGLANIQSATMMNDVEEWTKIATRLGDDSIKLCIIPDRLYKKLKVVDNRATASTEDAKEILRYSVSMRNVEDLKNELKGAGHLEGCVILKAEQGDSPTEDLSCGRYLVSRELGLIVQGER